MDKEQKLKELEGNQVCYHLENTEVLENSPISGKRLCFLGSSVTAGDSSFGVSFMDYIAKRNNCICMKEAVGGTTLVEENESSYISRMKNNINSKEWFDAFICQFSTENEKREIRRRRDEA